MAINLLLDDEQQLIVDSAISFLADASPMSRVRTVSDCADGIDHTLWRGLAEMGWCGVQRSLKPRLSFRSRRGA